MNAVKHWSKSVSSAPWLHQEVGRRMAEQLAFIKYKPQTWMDWQAVLSGSASFLAQHYPQAKGILVEEREQAANMLLQQMRRSNAWWAPTRWKKRHYTSMLPALVSVASTDLLWANMTLHFIAAPLQQMQQWQRLLKQDGFAMFSCFGPDTLKELRAVYAAQEWGPAGIEFADMHDLGDMMVEAGFTDPVMDMELIQLRWANRQAMLDELRTLGMNVHPQRYSGLRGRCWRAQFEEALQDMAIKDEDGKTVYSLTFEIIYGHAFKLSSGIKAQEQTSFGLDEMRATLKSQRK